MPVVDDYSEEDDDLPSGGGSRSSGGGSGVRTTEATPQQAPEFTPWSRFVSANADVSQREANKLAAGVQGDVDKAVSGRESAVATQNSAIGSNYNAAAQRPQVPQFGEVKPTASEPSFGAGRTSSFGSPAPAPSPKAAAAAQQTANRQDPGAVGGPKPAVAMFGGVNADKLNTDLSSGKPVTSAGDISGAKDLEASMGAAPWSKLVGDTEAAEKKAGLLGSDAGVEALLQQQGASPNSAFDAALVGGAGGQQFRDISKKYGGDSLSSALTGANETAQGQWSRLMGDIDAASAARDAEINTANVVDPAAAGAMDQAARDADAAKNRQELEDTRNNFMKGIQAYSIASQQPGTEPAVNGLGSQKDFLAALQSGAKYGDGVAWDNLPSVKDQMATASNALGISPEALAKYFERMTGTEWLDFWLLGVIPPWMEGVQGYGYGKPGGWESPYIEQVAGYGDDGGMWNAITNMWKDGAMTILKGATGGPLGAVEAGVSAATYKGPGAGKK